MTVAKATATSAAKKKTLTVIQTGSTTKAQEYMCATLKGLGLGKPRARKVLEDTPSVRGMIRAVRHLVAVENEGEIHG